MSHYPPTFGVPSFVKIFYLLFLHPFETTVNIMRSLYKCVKQKKNCDERIISEEKKSEQDNVNQ